MWANAKNISRCPVDVYKKYSLLRPSDFCKPESSFVSSYPHYSGKYEVDRPMVETATDRGEQNMHSYEANVDKRRTLF